MEIEINEKTLPILENIADNMPGGFFIYHADADEKLIYYNKSMLRIFGCKSGEEFECLTGNSFRGIVHPEDFDQVEHSIQKQIRDSECNMDYVEYRIVRKDGTIRWVEDYGHCTHTSMYGDVFYVFMEDATERLEKRMAELEEINEELRNVYARESQYKKAILQDAVDFFEVNLSRDSFIANASQVVDRKIVDISESVRALPPVSYSAYIEMRVGQVSEAERENYRKFFDAKRLIRCYYKGELEQSYEVWSVDSLGRRRMRHYKILLGRQESTEDIVALSVCTDMTDQMERQNLLQIALRQAQSANIARNVFLGNMSHDLRTPLNAIVGYAELLTEYGKDSKIAGYVEKIKHAGNELLSLVKESMEVTWAESGKAVLAEACCDIEDLIQNISDDFGVMMEKKRLDFSVECEDIRHRYIYADSVRLREIIEQLLDNAVKYTNTGGAVRLSVREEQNSPKGYGKFVFSVQDNGIGIEEDFKEELFQAFTRAKNTTMSKVLGSGLGLTVAKTFVEMMEGTIDVESKAGEGSTFTVKILFRLGEESSAKQQVQVQALERSLLEGRKILLVEDNELNSEIAQELLAQYGFVIETAENGQIALEKVGNSTAGYYSAVLMDIQMPVMDGYEATRRIRKLKNSELANIPIIALSANTFSEDQQKALESGMDAHFPKPIEIEGLVDLLCRVLAKVL